MSLETTTYSSTLSTLEAALTGQETGPHPEICRQQLTLAGGGPVAGQTVAWRLFAGRTAGQ